MFLSTSSFWEEESGSDVVLKASPKYFIKIGSVCSCSNSSVNDKSGSVVFGNLCSVSAANTADKIALVFVLEFPVVPESIPSRFPDIS